VQYSPSYNNDNNIRGNKLMTIMYKGFVACHIGRVQFTMRSFIHHKW